MPIYEQTYRRWEARGPLRSVRFWPITREALSLVLAKRAFIGLLVLVWIPFVVRVIQVYVVTRFPDIGRIVPLNGQLFGEFLKLQGLLTGLLTIFGGAGLIANDLRTGAILVYLSRPLTRRDYVLGKLAALMGLNYSATLAPALLLYVTAVGLAPGVFLKWELAWIAPMIVLYATLICLVLSLIALAISALSRTARVAGLAFAGSMVGLEIVRGVVVGILDSPLAQVVSVRNDLRLVGNALFGIADSAALAPSTYAAVVLVLAVAGCLAILRSRVRAVEIVR